MATVDMQKLSQIPYLDVAELPGRFLSTLMFYDSGWRMWMVAGDAGDQLIEVKAWPAEMSYFSAAAEAPDDIHIHFLDFIAQRACFQGFQKPFVAIQDDILNLSASLAKLSLLHSSPGQFKQGASRMAATEVEYIFAVCRSLYDLLQELICKLWSQIRPFDTSKPKKQLKETFSEMLKGNISSASAIAERFNLPEPLADCYFRNAPQFLALRRFRDNVVHRGSQVQTIFNGESGFLIQRRLTPFSDVHMWREDEILPNELVPLLPALGMVIHGGLRACNEFSVTLQQIIQFPPPVVPAMGFFMRGYFNKTLLDVLRDADLRYTEGRFEPKQKTDS